MQQLAGDFADVPLERLIEREVAVWPAVERVVKSRGIDLIVLGTHGRSGISRLLLGSVAEEIFRRATVPVLTIGPRLQAPLPGRTQFHSVLFATDLAGESRKAALYAFSFAPEDQSSLGVLHVVPESRASGKRTSESDASAMVKLRRLFPEGIESWCQPEPVVRHGDPADEILAVAKQHHADLLVLGIRETEKHVNAATHFARATAHRVVVQATCPALTVRN
jgi:nucleotide-binding universal stress UspA family protein